MKQESQRQKRVATQVKELVAEAFYTTSLGAAWPGRVTISDVHVSKDLKHAQVFFMVLDGATSAEQKELEKALDAHAKEVNTYVARRLSTKYTPKVKFFYDAAYEAANRIDDLLKKTQINHGEA